VGRSFLVRIKLDVLRANLSAADGEAYTRADIRQWLLDAGFEPAGEWWRVNESGLRLEASEVVKAIPEAEFRRKVRVA
jgi:hypothetical protein